MADNPYNSSDLNSVLQTLSSLASLNSSQNASIPRREAPQIPQRQKQEIRPSERPYSNPPRSSTGTPTTDPATITTWPAALRYVMRAVGQSEETQLRIRGLIRSQHSHEQQWWKAREILLGKQQARGEKKKELDAVLRSIGAPVDSKEVSSMEEDKEELANYDAKVYRASAQMTDAMTAELRGLKIPFFVIQQSLIQEPTESNSIKGFSAQEKRLEGSATVTKAELASLQRRMLELLQDLCKE
ncbi:hypothetical protein N7448_008178 [Penicillium atrosanguineum]|uniref:Uncharacterized protein n=1 Tax=Penicillium atrosanguineum TaxID=1132637 RepID=A0A9W9KYV5_9EURO|nr:uncharacterized protein N7443_000808 [Penicillium atrosanguineum]KAJ5127399.1 hypothetical protein N7448_008178 [Penicillium atrosanguineum]KAJ5147602.1 hypothetical protein N7526_000954 [Penicillium atrosanguineum]KAJ5313924.1 hypothetical protein N7443_000808 [Penicillium atrosanguineum]KAJ5331094.1 hypothetical protein N7476_000877 [Penicillium atrosanguineum]